VSLIIKDGRVLDPANGIDRVCDLEIDKGRIVRRGSGLSGERVVDAKGLWVLPGLIDMHVHLREPGYEYKETIETGSRAAAAGGFTTVACMANTDPVNDNGSVTDFIVSQARRHAAVRIYPIGAMTKGLQGEQLAEIGEMNSRGVVALSDDGTTAMNAEVMRRGMEYARTFGLPVIAHCDDLNLSRKGVVHEGEASMRLGLPGIPDAAEACIVARDILLAELTGAALHVAHVSSRRSVELIRRAREGGVAVTAEVTPHHLTLTDSALVEYEYDTNLKVNPPLRTEADRQALVQGLCDGTLDAVASDHAPHNIAEKEVEFEKAAFGMIGLETSLPLLLRLVHAGTLTPSQLVQVMAVAPARILGIPGGTLGKGADADVALVDPDRVFSVDAETLLSRSRNTPFGGWALKGKAVCTLHRGKTVYADREWKKQHRVSS
jgi:dihydroorotase